MTRIAEYFVLIVLVLAGGLLLDLRLREAKESSYTYGYYAGRKVEFDSWRKVVIDTAQGKQMVFDYEPNGRDIRWWVAKDDKAVYPLYASGCTAPIINIRPLVIDRW